MPEDAQEKGGLTDGSGEVGAQAVAAPVVPPAERPRVTIVAFALCIAVFLVLAGWPEWAFVVAPEGMEVWSGAYWGLLTSVFVHFDFLHLLFNIYWLWHLGRLLEPAIGVRRYVTLFAAAGVVSSAFQLAFSDSTGVGASGVVYALFGFMWLTKRRYPEFGQIITPQNIGLMLAWLVLCYVLTYQEILMVGNEAHLSGLVFGMLVALPVLWSSRILKWLPGCMVVASLVPLFWAPWSTGWLSVKAYDAHVDLEMEKALELYTRIIQLDPRDAWAYANRSAVHETLGQQAEAAADLKRAGELDKRYRE